MEDEIFLYEEHQCPTNWIDDVQEIFFDGSDDPHGLFRYVDSSSETREGFEQIENGETATDFVKRVFGKGAID